MQKRENNKKVALFQILNLIISVIAFCFLINLAIPNISAAIDLKDLKEGDEINTGWGPEMIYDSEYGLAIHDVFGSQLPLSYLNEQQLAEFNLVRAALPGTPVSSSVSSIISDYKGEMIDIPSVGKGHPFETPSGETGITTSKSENIYVSRETLENAIIEKSLDNIKEGLPHGGGTVVSDPNSGTGWALRTGNTVKPLSKEDLIKIGSSVTPAAAKAFSFWGITGVPGHLLKGLVYGAAIVSIIQMMKGMGLGKGIANSLSYGAFAGIMAGKAVHALFPKLSKGLIGSTGIGIGVGILVFVLTYKKESKKIVEFTCKPWQPPIGGQDCEKCNKDPLKPCSEYRCKSLGQACELINVGTIDEMCIWKKHEDVSSPGVKPWPEVLTKDHSYKEVVEIPPGGQDPGRIRIWNDESTDGCIKAFTPLQFGISNNEPGQCKIDYDLVTYDAKNPDSAFESMQYWFGENNLFLYNHTQRLSLPGPSSMNAQAPELQNNGEYSLYVRCRDANGNFNAGAMVIDFCVEKGPDTTPPKIEKTSVGNGMPVAYDTAEIDLEVYINEPVECRWSRLNAGYELMENNMQCSENIWEMEADLVYKCATTLTGIKNREENKFYFKCKDQPWLGDSIERNKNEESYEFILQGTQPLNIIHTEPNGTIKGSTNIVPVTLGVETANGYNEGYATCYFSTTNNEADYIKFYETGKNIHKQQQDLEEGTYTYYFKCVDLGGNVDYDKTTFTLKVDKQAPQIIRAYKDGTQLKIITDEESSCHYSTQDCNFNIEEGINMPYSNQTEHFVDWDISNTYYIRCKDIYNNQPLPIECTLIIKVYNTE